MSEADTSVTTMVADETPRARTKLGWPVFTIVAIAVLAYLIGGFGGSYQAKLSKVAKNDNAAYLPSSAESTHVANESAKFLKIENIPGFIVFHRDGGLTDQDKAAVAKAFTSIAAVDGVDKAAMKPTEFSTDGTTASIFAPLVAKDNGVAKDGVQLSDAEKKILEVARQAPPAGLAIHSAGVGGLIVAFIDSFAGVDGALLFTALGIVFLILFIAYRSLALPFYVLISALLALGLSSIVVYLLAKHDVITLTGQSQSILSVLVLGAGTDYALLLVSRYREELHEFDRPIDAMIVAWKASIGAIVASAATVIIGMLCLSFSELNSNKSLGPVAAVGIASTFIVMTTYLPVSLIIWPKIFGWPFVQLLAYVWEKPRRARPANARGIFWLVKGTWVFWWKVPKFDHKTPLEAHGVWGRVAKGIGARPRPAWIATTVALLIMVIGLTTLKTGGLTITDSFTNTPDAVTGQKIYDAKFDKGAGAPVVITTSAAAVPAVMAVVEKDAGILQKAGAVCLQVDYAKIASASPDQLRPGADGCLPAAFNVAPVDGRTVINATLADSYDSNAAYNTVSRLRTSLHALSNADVQVGGSTAVNLDVRNASVHDRNLIIPIVLVVILIVLSLLLRAILAPVLLIATVVLSFAATLGVCGFMFTHVFGFKNADQSFPLFAFVFLVALGIDYNIFLMTRVREETLQFGTREGVLRGLAVTGGVITSAGIVLAATFAVLGLLPLVFIAELGFAVAFGVLLDTLIVRSVLVPALSHDIGKTIWWPSKLASAQD